MYTNGSDMVQLWDNWNLVLYGMWRQRYGWDDDIGQGDASSTMDSVARLFRYRASTKSDDLFASLLRSDPSEKLPRVVFCNLTWVLLHENNANDCFEDGHRGDEDGSRDIKDHQWTIIKHGDDSFQVVQGYMDDNDTTTMSKGCCLSSWQNHPQPGRFASRHGFSAAELTVFCGGIRRFAISPCFDALSYQQLFGMWHPASNGVAVWPSVSFRELDDDSIEGYGDRFAAHSVEAAMHSFEPGILSPSCVVHKRRKADEF
jgi:hypothetical protein